MNTNTDNQGKERVLKTLAIGGFVGLIIIIAWLGIQLISFMPNAFSSLASLADSVYNYKPVELVVVSNKAVANAGEAFSISWNKPKQAGTFAFSYECTDGVSVEVRAASNKIDTVTCAEEFKLGAVDMIDLSINSERNRFEEIPYTISFIPAKSNTASAEKANTITVVNAMISPVIAEEATTTPIAVVTDPEITDPEIEVPEKPEVTVTPPPAPVVVTKPVVKPVTPKPVVVTKPVYTIPVSNPNGTSDIGVRSLGAGSVDNNNRFANAGIIDNDLKGAIQFEIKNLGTKTSEAFTYTATLPSGTVYTSPVQPALKPNERIIATIGFDATDLSGIKTFSATVNVAGDANRGNNLFNSAVQIND